MNVKSEKGYAGIDIATSVIVIFIFISVVAVLSHGFNSSMREVAIRSEATTIAVEEIENLKNELNFEEIKDISINNGNSEYSKLQELPDNKGYYKRVVIEDYADKKTGKTAGLVKKATVQIQYVWNGKTQTVELSTIFAKEN